MTATFTIPGKPMAKQRPRVTSNGTFTPQQTIDYENFVKYIYQSEVGKFLEGPFKAEITAYFPIPKSASKKKKVQMLSGEIRPTIKGDADNIAKMVLDSINNIAYKDDSYCVELIVKKIYSEVPRVEVVLKTL